MQKIKLGDVLDVKRGASLSGDYYAEEGKYVRLTLGNFNYPGGGFKENTSKSDIYFVGPIKPEFILNEGDIITPLTEQVSGLLGETATIPEGGKYIQSGDVGLVIPDETKLDKRFAYYLIASPIVKKQLDAAAQQTKIRHTSPDAIKACEAWIPEDISVQASIGRLLDSINEKIANNNAICSNLEAMAKLLYDYWFVQFDFPDENGKPYKSSGGKMVWNDELKREIPAGWETKPLSDIFDITMGSSPSGESINVDGNGVEFYQGSTDFGVLYPSIRVYTTSPVRFAKAQDVLMSVRAPVGDMNIAMNDCCIGRGLAAIHHRSTLYAWCTMLTFRPYFDFYNGNGTTFGALTSDDLKGQLMVVPPDSVLNAFMQKINAVGDKLRSASMENQQLASLRDFLLPMLMNGQVKVR